MEMSHMFQIYVNCNKMPNTILNNMALRAALAPVALSIAQAKRSISKENIYILWDGFEL
jgi:hypothetical protein